MVIWVLASLGLMVGLPPVLVGVVVAGSVSPWLFLAGVGGWAGWHAAARRRRRPGPEDEARFLEGVAAELTAGASLRLALAEAASRAPALPIGAAVRLARVGRPAAEVGGAVRTALTVNGVMAAAAIQIASSTGAATARLFTDLAGRAREQAELARERQALTAQAKLSAWVVGGAPILLVLLTMAVGDGLDLVRRPYGALILAIGLGLEAAGVIVVWWMLRRAAP